MSVPNATFNLADLWELLVDAGPDAECLVAGDTRHTRGSLDIAANRVANHLMAEGIRIGDHVGIYTRNCAAYVEALLGCWKCGAIPVNINWRYVVNELRYVVDDAQIVAMIVADEYRPLLDELRFELRIGLGEWSTEPTSRNFDAIPRSSDDVYMLYTGGTTGMPKGVMWRHEDFFYACCLGGSPVNPIAAPGEIVRNDEPQFQMSPLVLGPLMHGGGQWLTLISLFGGNPRSSTANDTSMPRKCSNSPNGNGQRQSASSATRWRARWPKRCSRNPIGGTSTRSSRSATGARC